MKKYTQRELINEISWSGVATGIGKGIGRAGLGLLRSISPKAGALADKLLKVDDNPTYGTPIDAVNSAIKYLIKSGQITPESRQISEINATQYSKLKQRATNKTEIPSRLRNFDLSKSKLTKYYYVGYKRTSSSKEGLSMPRDQTSPDESHRKDMLFTVIKAPSSNRLETAKWRVEKVEDATPPPPKPGTEVNPAQPKTVVAAAVDGTATQPKPITRVPIAPGVTKKIRTS